MFGVLLFVIYYICLVHLFAPASSNQVSEMVEMPAQPIEQQLKEVLWSDVEPETTTEVTTVTEVEEKPAAIALRAVAKPIADPLEGIEVEKLTLRKARKVAKALDIRQKVRGKDQPKAFLVAQIAKKLKANPEEVAPIIIEQVRAA